MTIFAWFNRDGVYRITWYIFCFCFFFKATINFTADGGVNGRPTITITTTRGPNSPTITATTSPTAANTFSYNIPVQHVYQNQQLPSASNESLGQTATTLPFTSNGGGKFIISTSSLSSLPQELFLNGSMISKPTLIGNGSYVIPVSMKLMNTNSGNPSTSTGPGATANRNNSLTSGSNSSNGLQQQLQQLQLQQQPSQQSSAQQVQLANNMPTSPKSPTNLGNIVIKTTSPTMMRGRVEDEVDLLKDLLIRNLNSAKEPNFYGICTRCNEKIVDAENGLRAMDNLFHVSCFVCYGCGNKINKIQIHNP